MYGGYAFNTTGSSAAINNTVTISNSPDLSGSSLHGGETFGGTGDAFSGNTLNVWNYTGSPIVDSSNFEHYNFILPAFVANGATALNATGTITLGDGGSKNSTLRVDMMSGGTLLQSGDTVTLINAATLNGSASNENSLVTARKGVSLLYDMQLAKGVNTITATVQGTPRVSPQLKALSEGYLSGLMLVSRGADAVAFDAHNAISAQNPGQGISPFALMSAGNTRYNSGSHIKSNDFLLMGGISYRYNALTAGAFIEGGWGSYDTYNSFYNAANVHGDGHNRYAGVGLLGRYDFENGLYTDASMRFGESRTKFDTTDIANFAIGQYASYNLKSSYASAHVGVGYILPINERNSVDLSAKYLWSGVGSKSATVAGDPIHFKRMNSHRIRLNAELNHLYSNALTLNAGLGYEHELDGKAKATTYHTYDIEAPSVKGGTGILSLGATIKPTSNQNLSLGLKVDGYAGKREGVRGSLTVNYAF